MDEKVNLPCIWLVDSLLDSLDWYAKEPGIDSLVELALCYVEVVESEDIPGRADALAKADAILQKENLQDVVSAAWKFLRPWETLQGFKRDLEPCVSGCEGCVIDAEFTAVELMDDLKRIRLLVSDMVRRGVEIDKVTLADTAKFEAEALLLL